MSSAAAARKAHAEPSRVVSIQTRRQIQHDALREMEKRCRGDLYTFVRMAWNQVPANKGTKFQANWHIEAFCMHVQRMLEGWLVAKGLGTAEMRERVEASWSDHGLDYIEGEVLVQNLVMNLPPITLKSQILMVFAPAWMWLHCPSWSLVAISSVDHNVKRDSHGHRGLVESAWYRDVFRIKWKIRAKVEAVGEWETTAGGRRVSATLLGGVTGLHVDAQFLDDPDDAHKVHSKPIREEVQNKWSRATKNRIKDPDISIRIAIQQRVHVDDWTSAQVAKAVWSPDDRKAWAWVVIPLLFGAGPKEAPRVSPWGWSDPRKAANDNLQPARFSASFIADEIREKGPEGFNAQYNQNPESYDDGMIKRSYVRFFRIVDSPAVSRARPHGCGIREDGTQEPALVLGRRPDGSLDIDWLTITVDCSNGGEKLTASGVGILVIGGRGVERFIFDDRTAVMGIGAMYDAIADTIAAYPVRDVLIELKAAGSSVIHDLRTRIRNEKIRDAEGRTKIVNLIAVKVAPNDSKESRAAAMLSAWSNGFVHVLDGASWLYPKIVSGGKVIDEGFIGEVCAFPRAKKNDRIDALSQLMTHYRENGDAKTKWLNYARFAR